MSGPICEWAVSASSVCYMFFVHSTHTHAHTHTPAFTHLEWCRPHEQFFGGWYTYVLITLLLQFMTEENRREGQEQTNTTLCTPHVHPHSYKVQAYPNRALRQIFVEVINREVNIAAPKEVTKGKVRVNIINYIYARQRPERRHQIPN